MKETITSLVQAYGYLLVFVLVGLESLGIPLPGETALVTAAAYAALGHLSIFLVILAAAGGAIVGDNAGYWIGRKGGRAFVLRYGRKIHLNETHLAKAEKFFHRHGGKTVFIGRFIALLRSWAALLAGIGVMPYGEFTAYNASGGIVWASVYGGLGYAFGRSLPTLERYVGQASLALVIVAALFVALTLAWRWFRDNQERVSQWLFAIQRQVMQSPALRLLRERYPRSWAFVAARFARGEYLGLHLTIGLLISVAGLWLFSGVTEDVLHHDPLTKFDLTLLQFLRGHATTIGDRVFSAISLLGSPTAMGVLGVVVAIVLMFKRQWIVLSGWLAAFVGAGILTSALKNFIQRPRPIGAEQFLHGTSFSFPSGHTLGSLIGYGMLAYLLLRVAKSRRTQVVIIAAALTLVLAIGFSRLYLGVHYFSDVVAGYAAGLLWLSSCISALEILRRRAVPLLPPQPAHMTRAFLFFVVLAATVCPFHSAASQQPARVTVVVTALSKPLSDAIVREDSIGARTDSSGIAVLTLTPGIHRLQIAKLGYAPDSISFSMPVADTTISVELAERVHSTATVIVTAARTEQRIEDVPLRVEVLAGEDVDEKNAMRPGDLTQMVSEIPGVRVQPSAPGIGGANLRIQGFRGQYTEFLTDGLPLTGASESGLSLVQLPPLDLGQIEVIKGASSALYGPTALGGVINFVSRRPPSSEQRQIRDAVVSSSTVAGVDVVGFNGRRLNDSWGYTILGGAHRDPRHEADSDRWADIVGSTRGEVRPRLFWNGANGARLLITTGLSADDRKGGFISSPPTSGGDELRSRHADIGAIGRVAARSGTLIDFRAALSGQARDHNFPTGNAESDRTTSGLAEISATHTVARAIFVAGLSGQTAGYSNKDVSGFDFAYNTLSAFTQTTITLSDAFSLSLTGRCDRHSRFGTACVPVAGVLLRQPAGFSERLSAGLGTFAPTPFVDEIEAVGFSRLRPFSGALAPELRYERARHVTLDVGYRSGGLDINASAYASRITSPVILHELASGPYGGELINAPGPANTRGLDVFAVYTGDPVSVTAFYGLLRARETILPENSTGAPFEREVPYNPAHRAGLDVAFDIEEIGSRFAVETYWTGRQQTENDPYRATTPSFATIEVLLTQKIGRQQLFLSVDNLTNVRQTNYGPLLLPAPSRLGRLTTELWSPLEGRTARAGIRASF